MERFHQYTYGRSITVESDHKPLEIIYKKPLTLAPKRLKRMLLRLQRYDILIQYKQGKEMYLADTLSRAYLPTTEGATENDSQVLQLSEVEKDLEKTKHADFAPISSKSMLNKIQQATSNDETMQELKRVIQKGWPTSKDELSTGNTLLSCTRRTVSPR